MMDRNRCEDYYYFLPNDREEVFRIAIENGLNPYSLIITPVRDARCITTSQDVDLDEIFSRPAFKGMVMRSNKWCDYCKK